LIARVGLQKVKKAVSKEHLPLVTAVERHRRKKANLKERAKLLALMGKKAPEERDGTRDQSDSESSQEEDEDDAIKGAHGSDDSESDESDSDTEVDNRQGTDLL
jgi:hypothetical protein